MIYAKFALSFLAGFLACILLDNFHTEKEPYLPTVTSKTQVITKQSPTKIEYKDKIRTIKIECPSQVATLENLHNVLTPQKIFTPKFSFGFYSNLKDYNLNVGYMVSSRLSLNAETNIKFDMILLGVTLYF